MATKTIVFYIGGTKCCIELLVSIYTLRKFYNGDISVVIGETSVPHLQQLIESKNIDTIIVPNTSTDRTRINHWVSRWKGLKLIDYDKVLHLDCDTIIVNPIDHLFNHIHPKKDYITTFEGLWITEGISKICLKSFRKIVPDIEKNYDFECYMELGMVGWNKGWPYFDLVSEYTALCRNDQEAMSLILTTNGHKAHMPQLEYKIIKKARAYDRLSIKDRSETLVWHVHHSHCWAFFWKYFLEARKSKFMNLHDNDYIKSVSPTTHKILINKSWSNRIFACSNKFGRRKPILEYLPTEE